PGVVGRCEVLVIIGMDSRNARPALAEGAAPCDPEGADERGAVKYLTVQEVTCTDPATFGVRLDPLMEALLGLEVADSAVEDPDLGADLGTGCMDVQMTVEAADPAAAMVKALATLRAAIHAIGGCGWEITSAIVHAAPTGVPGLLASA
ncbi:MAG: hypothetical protein J2P30_25475, partial [Actinobacteria bacterium]|nr:hypothetical protein [Actinomycetota bacterium]